MKHRLALLLLAPLAACGDGGANVDFGGADLGEDRFSIQSANDAMRMGLTDDFVYFALSDSVLNEARAQLADTMPREGVGGVIAGAFRGSVSRALSFRAKYLISDIRDIRWEDGRMVVDFVDDRRSLGRLEVDDEPVDRAFTEPDVRAFAREFRKVKRARGETVEGPP